MYRAGTRLLKYFEKRCKELDLNFEGIPFEEEAEEPKVKKLKLDNDNFEENGTTDSEDDNDEAQKRR